MDPIYDIGIDDITVYIPEPNSIHPPVLPNIHPPITVDLGFPIVEIPGCVEAHQDNNREGKPWDKDLVNDDPDQTMVLCPHGSYPSYNAMNFEPERTIPTIQAPPPPVPPPPGLDGESTSVCVLLSPCVPVTPFKPTERPESEPVSVAAPP